MGNNTTQELYYDEYDAVRFIAAETGLKKSIIRAVLNAELRYQQSVGIINWEDLDEYINAMNDDPEFMD